MTRGERTEQGGIIHQCSICGNEAPWSGQWQWYGSIKIVEGSGCMVKTCSDDCRSGVGQKALDRLLNALIVASEFKRVFYLGPRETRRLLGREVDTPPVLIDHE